MENMWFFENVNLYQVLCPHKLKEYQGKHLKKYTKGDVIYVENELSQKIYLVSKGKVKVMQYNEDGDEMVKAILTKGQIFGEMALLGEQKRKDFALCISKNTDICYLDIEVMHTLMRKNNSLSLKIYKLIGLKIRRLERRLELLVFKDVKTRLLEFIKELAEEHSVEQEGTWEIPHIYTHKDIADLIGARRETVTHLLGQFKKENMISYERQKFIVKDLKYLETSKNN